MAVWLRSANELIGVEDGIVRNADFAELLEACELNTRAAQALARAGEEAAHIVASAIERAEENLLDAERRGEVIKAEAYATGLREAAERWCEEMVEKAFEAQVTMRKASERLAELVSLAAQRVLEAEDKEGLYRRALRTVREVAKDSKSLVLHIGAADIEHARSVVALIAADMNIDVPLEIKVDTNLPTGGCVLESDYGVIDASLGLQIEAVKAAICKAARAALARSEPPEAAIHTATP